MEEITKLFEPIHIGNLELKNRIIMAAMVTNYATIDGFVTDRLMRYHANIARGGCAMNTTEASYVSLEGKRIACGLGVYDDKLIPGLRELATAVHNEGGRISLQVFHGGRECSSEITGLQPIGPTDLPSRYRGIAKKTELPRQMTIEDIELMVSNFGDAARRAREAGFDAVEIHAAHGYIITQFLSPYSNKRTDSYGGDIVNRTKFLVEIIQDVKRKAGDDFPVVVKLNINDYVEGGIVPEDARVTAKLVAEAGAHAIVASVGLHESRPYMMIPPMSIPHFPNIHLSELIKQDVDIPVASIGRVTEPRQAGRIILEGKADLVSLGRALLSDPEWPKKALQGKLDEIRECIACNQGCIDKCHRMQPIACLQNPVTGREKEFRLQRTEKPKKVAVIGGGPGGLEAARVAALRGHHVYVYEKEDELGGQLRLAKIPPNRADLEKTVNHLIGQVTKLGVRLELGTQITAENVGDLDVDVIVLATGASPLFPDIKGIHQQNVVPAMDVLSGKAPAGQRVVVVGAGLVGLETADFLVELGRRVIVIEALDTMAADSGHANRVYFEEKFSREGVEILLGAKVTSITEEGVTYTRNGWTYKIQDVDTVVLATGAIPYNPLKNIAARHPELQVFEVGDCRTPRDAMEAIYEGAKIALEI